MKIALLCHALRAGGGISIGQNLISALGDIAPDERYFISIPGGIGYETVCDRLPNREVLILPHSHSKFERWKCDHRSIPGIVERFRPDVVVGMGSFGYQGKSRFPQAILLHNPYLIYPSRNYGRTNTRRELLEDSFRRWLFARDLTRTGLLFPPTSSSAERIRGRYNYRGRFVTLPNAISKITLGGKLGCKPPKFLQAFTDRFKLFYLAKYYTHKNIEILVDLYDFFRDELAGTVLFITVSEDQHPAVRKLLISIQRKKLDGLIVNLGPLPQEELANYYRHMDALLMPSLLEIFSGTYLEAMHFEVPILTSDLDFAREICGDAAYYFDPWDVTAIKEAVLRLRNDHGLVKSLVDAGRKRLEGSFVGWDEVTGIFLESLRELAGKEGA